MGACQHPGCTGSYSADGYCDECGRKAPAGAPAASTPGLAPGLAGGVGGGAAGGAGGGQAGGGPASGGQAGGAAPSVAGVACRQAGCSGRYGLDGYCEECGHKAPASLAGAAGAAGTGPAGGGAGTGTGRSGLTGVTVSGTQGMSGLTGRGTMSGLTGTGSSRGRSRRGRLGAGLVDVPPVPLRDPATAVLPDPKVPESKRFCGRCEKPVGRGQGGRAGRTEGFCPHCGTRFTFIPRLAAGDVVDRRYEILGALAHGGLGWIYLARDRNVSDAGSDRWVVLKGLINTGDPDAMAAAMAERRFLVEVDHPNMVKIHDFAQHPDPRSGEVHSYIVMEYVGGQSLRDLALSHVDPAGRRLPLPLPQVLAYAIEVLPALGYLHEHGLVFCDFKPDNVIQAEEQIKIIDLGAVRRLDDPDGAIYGTPGYQAPDVAEYGPTVGSDLYTVGRAMAVLSFDFRGFSSKFASTLPSPDEVPLLAAEESYHRLLRRATELDLRRRFASAGDLAEQVTGVLREVLSAESGTPTPAPSNLFTPERHVFGTLAGQVDGHAATGAGALTGPAVVAALPVPQVDIADPGAGFLATLGTSEPASTLGALRNAPVRSLEVRLALVRASVEAGDLAGAAAELDALVHDSPADWRFDWYAGLLALASGRPADAVTALDRLYDALPGEAAAKLALAAACELAGDPTGAARRYQRIWVTDRGFVSAAFGLARILVAAGEPDQAVTVLDEVPDSSSQYVVAQLAAVRARLRPGRSPLTEADLVDASTRLERLELDAERRASMAVEVFDAALGWIAPPAGRPALPRQPAGPVARAAGRVLGQALSEREVRFGLERAYRALAGLQREPAAKHALVDRANEIRPRTLV
jgi:serine/threonine-protein kinase PknG